MKHLWLSSLSSFAVIEAHQAFFAKNAGQLETALEQAQKKASIFSFANDEAHLQISGSLVFEIDNWSMLFGLKATTYGSIVAAIREANATPHLQRIIMHIDSPGGTAAGLDLAVQAMRASALPIDVEVATQCCSAAYWLASQARTIKATNRLAEFGSIGVASTFYDWSKADEKIGVKTYTFTSTHAPKKRPDVTTPDGQSVVQEQLDAIEAHFLKDVADGRGVTTEQVVATFGAGTTYLAVDALAKGMIDSIDSIELNAKINKKNKETKMSDTSIPNPLVATAEPPSHAAPLPAAPVTANDSSALNAALSADRARVAELNSYARQFPSLSTVVDNAIANGLHAKDIMAEVVEAAKMRGTVSREAGGQMVEKLPSDVVTTPPGTSQQASVSSEVLQSALNSIMNNNSEVG